LGGLRHTTKDSINIAWRNKSFRGYADYMQTSEFAAGIDELINLAQGYSASYLDAVQGSQEERANRTNSTVSERQTPAELAMRQESPQQQALPDDPAAVRSAVIMCAEAVPWRCHRSLVGDALLVRGHEVIDIFDKGKSVAEKVTNFAKVEGIKISYPASN
jgi:uncharacterized protein (DUF488 family)